MLDSIDEAIEGSEAVTAATENLRDALLHRLLTRGVPGWHSEWKEVRGIGPIPATWEVVRVRDIVAGPRGAVSGPFGSSIGSKFYVKEGVPVIRGNNLATEGSGKRFLDQGFVFLTEEKADELSASECLPNDLVFTARGTIGQVGLIPSKPRYPRYIASANQLRIRCNMEMVCPLFLYYWFNTSKMVRRMLSSSTSTAVPNMNLGALKSLHVALPNLSEQQAIAELLDGVDDAIERGRTETQMLQSLKASTADALLTGRVRVGTSNADLKD